MKELSIEEKARRYDEAIIKFKPIYDLAKEQGRTIDVKEFENIFPELKKFEDDDIKKWLIGYFNQYIIDGMPQVFGNGLNVKDVIEWLEKQGEQVLANSAKTCKDEQTPALSEEDEATISRVISIVKWAAYSDHSHPILNDKGANELIEQLKSLKDRYTWKPSEEQIAVLE